MQSPLKVNRIAVRRFLLDKQGLGKAKPLRPLRANAEDVLRTISTLECVQIDPVAAVERNQHLVLSARMPGYKPELLEELLAQRRVFEYWANAACIIPMQDYPMFEVVRRRFHQQLRPQLEQLGSVVKDLLRRLEVEGPLPSKEFGSSVRVHGYWDNTQAKTKATSHALNLLNDMGLIQVVRREGTTRFFDILERSVASHLLAEAEQISETEARNALFDKYLRAYRVFSPGDARFGWQPMTAEQRRQAVNLRVMQGSVVPLQIENVKRPYYILAQDVEELLHHADTAMGLSRSSLPIRFLGPLDNLLWRRDRIEDLFEFSYTWEVYTPAVKRRFGYYAMPILAGDRIIGRIDPKLDRVRARLDIRLLQIEPGVRVTKLLRQQLGRALDVFAAFHGAELGTILRTEPEGLFV